MNSSTAESTVGARGVLQRRAATWQVGAWRLTRRSPLGLLALVILSLLVATAILAPTLANFDPLELHRRDRLLAPNMTYWLGTDSFGRDQYSRLLYGTRVSLWVGFAPIAISALVGGLCGLFSGYVGGSLDNVVQRVMDSLMAFPALVLVLVIVSLLGPSVTNVVLVLAVVTIPTINRVARGATLSVMSQPYVEAARAVGASNARVVTWHVAPNILAPVIVVAASLIGTAILAEASLSFLGLGVPPPAPTWGNMLGGQNRDLFEVAPWLAVVPGVAITVTVLAFNLLGDALRDLLDPKSRRLHQATAGTEGR